MAIDPTVPGTANYDPMAARNAIASALLAQQQRVVPFNITPGDTGVLHLRDPIGGGDSGIPPRPMYGPPGGFGGGGPQWIAAPGTSAGGYWGGGNPYGGGTFSFGGNEVPSDPTDPSSGVLGDPSSGLFGAPSSGNVFGGSIFGSEMIGDPVDSSSDFSPGAPVDAPNTSGQQQASNDPGGLQGTAGYGLGLGGDVGGGMGIGLTGGMEGGPGGLAATGMDTAGVSVDSSGPGEGEE